MHQPEAQEAQGQVVPSLAERRLVIVYNGHRFTFSTVEGLFRCTCGGVLVDRKLLALQADLPRVACDCLICRPCRYA